MNGIRRKAGTKIFGLGVDTGGTYTDAVIVDLATKKVLAKAKAPTTYHDLSVGLRESIDRVLEASHFDVDLIRLVGVSTTLATNSVLEGKGGKVGLIGIGWSPEDDWNLGSDRQVFIQGGHTVEGRTKVPLIEEELDEAVQQMSDMDAVVVSGLFSVYNQSHEEEVRRKVIKELGIPVVAGHELTGELGVRERTVTAVLNARLIPVLDSFLEDVEHSLGERGITASIMVFKGDGSLMNLEMARERPVETILSGPAASAMGGRILAGLDDCIVIDVGGTSTDIAFLDGGFPRVSPEGATIGGWRTRVKAVDMWTTAIGGDSEVLVDRRGNISISSKRVIPLCFAVNRYRGLMEKMKSTYFTRFFVSSERTPKRLSRGEEEIFAFVSENGPVTIDEIKGGVEVVLVDGYVSSLLDKSLIIGVGLTPTDILHATEHYMEGEPEASRFGIEMAAHMARMATDEFCSEILNMVAARISKELIRKIMQDEGQVDAGCSGCDYLLDLASGARPSRLARLNPSIQRKIVGIGAPAHIYLPMIQERLGTEVIVPENHEVGNAVGAVCSQIVETTRVVVFPKEHKYTVFAHFYGSVEYEHIEQAVGRARTMAAEYVRERAERAGAKDVKVSVEVEEKKSPGGFVVAGEITHWVEVKAKAVGQPTIV